MKRWVDAQIYNRWKKKKRNGWKDGGWLEEDEWMDGRMMDGWWID